MNVKCLACDSSNLIKLFSFGNQAAANRLLDSQDEQFDEVELALDGCVQCGHMQQHKFYSPSALFVNYFYQSNTSKTLLFYFKWLSQEILSHYLPKNSRVLEIASNDGSFIKEFRKVKPDAAFVGIDPAINIAKMALNDGVATVSDFFPSDELTGIFDVIVAQNVLAHSPEPIKLLKGIKKHLADNGVAYIQVSQANMLDNAEFDTLYHEHYSFFSDFSMSMIAERAGLKLHHVIVVDIHGGSKGYFITHSNFNLDCNKIISDKKFLLNSYSYVELINNFNNKFDEFSASVNKKINLIKEVHNSYAKSKRVLVGVAAKSVTVLQSCKLEYDFIFDEAPLKIGKYIPGTKNKIMSLNNVKEISGDVVYFIGAWNFYDEIKEKLTKIIGKRIHTVCFFPYYKDDKPL